MKGIINVHVCLFGVQQPGLESVRSLVGSSEGKSGKDDWGCEIEGGRDARKVGGWVGVSHESQISEGRWVHLDECQEKCLGR